MVINKEEIKSNTLGRTPEELEEDVQAFINHPLNLKELDEKALQDPNIQALQSLVFDGPPEEIAEKLKVYINS